MLENIFLVQELLKQYTWKRVSPRCLIKVDLRKAYDTIEWNFIEEMLRALRLPEKFVGWVMQCVTTTSFSLSINGSLHGFFKGQRGIRQGDPLSPSIFTLCLEYLSRRLVRISSMEGFNFHPKCKELQLNHLAYADDLILFARGDITSVGMLLEELQEFGECSGLKSSVEKSNIYLAGIGKDRDEIKRMTGFREGEFPFRYLGIPLVAARLKISQYSPLINRLTEYIDCWPGYTLTYAGRIELVRSILQGVECFWLSALPVPEGVKQKVNSLCRNFIWGGKKDVYKQPLVSWKTACLPKAEGGLGLKCLSTWNKALLAKILWNIQAKADTLWVKWIHQNYFKKDTVWQYQTRKGDTHLIKHLMKLRDQILNAEGSTVLAQQRLQNWGPSGVMEIGKAYDYFRNAGQRCIWAKVIWNNFSMPKHTFFFWLAMKGKLRTKDKVLTEQKQCILCKEAEETSNHLFFCCKFVKKVWDSIKQWLGVDRRLSTVKAAVKWLIKEAKGNRLQSKLRKISVAAVIYTIWETRNLLLHEEKKRTPAAAVKKIQLQVYRVLNHLYPNLHGI